MSNDHTVEKQPAVGLLDRFVTGIVNRRMRLALWVIVIGFVLVATSVPLSIATVSFTGMLQNGFNAFAGVASPNGAIVAAKQVGFLAALNWSLFCTVVAPAVVYFGLSTIRSFDTTLGELCSNGMIRDAGFRRVEYRYVRAQWAAHIRANRVLFAFVASVVLVFIMYDWWSVVANPILNSASVQTPISDPTMEYDWSVASIFEGATANSTALLVFGLVAYLIYAGLIPALVIGVTLCTIYYMYFITSLSVNDEDFESGPVRFAAVPTTPDEERHFGFSAFSELFHNFLLMSLFILFGLWLMAVQNVYLRDLSTPDIYRFVVGETEQYARLADGSVSIGDFLNWFITPARVMIYNPQVALSTLLVPFICIVSVVGCWFILRHKALRAQALSLNHPSELAKEFGIPKGVLTERLKDEMEVWPVGWITSHKLVWLMFLLFASLISYRIIVVPLLFTGALGVASAVQILVSRDRR